MAALAKMLPLSYAPATPTHPATRPYPPHASTLVLSTAGAQFQVPRKWCVSPIASDFHPRLVLSSCGGKEWFQGSIPHTTMLTAGILKVLSTKVSGSSAAICRYVPPGVISVERFPERLISA